MLFIAEWETPEVEGGTSNTSDGRALKPPPGLNRKRKEATVARKIGRGSRGSSPPTSRERAKGIDTMTPLSTSAHSSGVLLDLVSQKTKVMEAPLLCATLDNPVGL